MVVDTFSESFKTKLIESCNAEPSWKTAVQSIPLKEKAVEVSN